MFEVAPSSSTAAPTQSRLTRRPRTQSINRLACYPPLSKLGANLVQGCDSVWFGCSSLWPCWLEATTCYKIKKIDSVSSRQDLLPCPPTSLFRAGNTHSYSSVNDIIQRLFSLFCLYKSEKKKDTAAVIAFFFTQLICANCVIYEILRSNGQHNFERTITPARPSRA